MPLFSLSGGPLFFFFVRDDRRLPITSTGGDSGLTAWPPDRTLTNPRVARIHHQHQDGAILLVIFVCSRLTRIFHRTPRRCIILICIFTWCEPPSLLLWGTL